MSTITVVRTASLAALATDALTSFDGLRLPPDLDAAGEKVVRVGGAVVGIVGYTAHHLVIQDALERYPGHGPDQRGAASSRPSAGSTRS